MNIRTIPSGKLTALWKITMFIGKDTINGYKWPFYIAMLVYQGVHFLNSPAMFDYLGMRPLFTTHSSEDLLHVFKASLLLFLGLPNKWKIQKLCKHTITKNQPNSTNVK